MITEKRFRLVNPNDDTTAHTSPWSSDEEGVAYVETYAREWKATNGSGFVMEVDTRTVSPIVTERFVPDHQGRDL